MNDIDKAALREMAATLIPTSWREAVQRALAELDAREKQAVSEAFVDAIRQARIEAAKEMRERAAKECDEAQEYEHTMMEGAGEPNFTIHNDCAIVAGTLAAVIRTLPIEGESDG